MSEEKILVAVDDSESSRAMLRVVAARASEAETARLLVCHLLPHLPPRLLESRGAEDPRQERRVEREQELAQARWIEGETAEGERLVRESRRALERGGVSGERIETEVKESHYSHERLADALLEEARANGCTMIAVGRHAFPAVRELLHRHLADELQKRAEGVQVWSIG